MHNPYLLLGTVVRPQGVRGEVKLRHETDDPERFAALQTVYLRAGETYRPLRVLAARAVGAEAYLTLEGVIDREAAEALRGQEVYVDRAHARPLAPGETFIADLLGAQATDTQGRPVGVLRDVLQNGGVDVLVFDTPRGTLMAPFLKRLVLALDTEAGRMTLDAQALREVGLYEHSDPDDLSGDA